MKILLAEDERELSKPLVTILEHSKYNVDAVYDGAEAYKSIKNSAYDLIILDIMMPYMSGLEVLEKIREEGISTPVLMLTAKAETYDKITGLDKGADDYLTKPFVMGELLARIRALTRRSEKIQAEVLEYKSLHLDGTNCELSGKGTAFVLANKEFNLAKTLIKNSEKEVSSSQLAKTVWDDSEEADERVLDMYISFIRNKIRAIDSCIDIKAVDGGYILGAE